MSMTPTVPVAPRRVRHQARESVALMVFSAAASGGFAALMLLLMSLGR